MTKALFRDDAYLRECKACVLTASDDVVVTDQTVFYPMGGGQPGDTGIITWQDHVLDIIDTRYGESGEFRHSRRIGYR